VTACVCLSSDVMLLTARDVAKVIGWGDAETYEPLIGEVEALKLKFERASARKEAATTPAGSPGKPPAT
jgi:hypothetical protein